MHFHALSVFFVSAFIVESDTECNNYLFIGVALLSDCARYARLGGPFSPRAMARAAYGPWAQPIRYWRIRLRRNAFFKAR